MRGRVEMLVLAGRRAPARCWSANALQGRHPAAARSLQSIAAGATAYQAAVDPQAAGGIAGASGREPFQELMAYVLAIGLLLTVVAVLGLRACARPGATRTFRRYRH